MTHFGMDRMMRSTGRRLAVLPLLLLVLAVGAGCQQRQKGSSGKTYSPDSKPASGGAAGGQGGGAQGGGSGGQNAGGSGGGQSDAGPLNSPADTTNGQSSPASDRGTSDATRGQVVSEPGAPVEHDKQGKAARSPHSH